MCHVFGPGTDLLDSNEPSLCFIALLVMWGCLKVINSVYQGGFVDRPSPGLNPDRTFSASAEANAVRNHFTGSQLSKGHFTGSIFIISSFQPSFYASQPFGSTILLLPSPYLSFLYVPCPLTVSVSNTV